ncbi:MAG TPA: peptidoglycan DD-metalloendopeptidase family protein [Thermoanaerobaculia bacterium]|nr:peptidoglycan DD-metalloendopeptidase family protein [Thermoanaerobaculia bacterium]
MRRTLAIALAAAICCLLLPSLAAQQPGDRTDLDRLKKDIRQLRGKLKNVRAREKSVETDLEAVELELQILGRELEAARSVEAGLEAQREAMAARVLEINAEVHRQSTFLTQRLATLYRMGRIPYLRMLLSMDPRSDPLRAVSMLAYMVGRDARAVSSFQQAQERLVLEEGLLAEKESELSETRRIVAARREVAARKREEKAVLLAQLQSESRRSAQHLADLEEKARRLERLFTLLYEESGPARESLRIAEVKGALDWPVRGEVIEPFGRQKSTEFDTYVVNNGIRIAADPGAPVRAVFTGTVLFAQWFKGYGNLIILDHGDRVFSLYGNTRGSSLTVGETVQAGATIASVAEGEEGSSGHLYFEIREDNRPTDPRGWLR